MSDCFEAQESIPASEDWASEEEDYDCYYGEEDNDVSSLVEEEEGPRDVSFQRDPEHYEFACLSTEEAWNFLDAQAREASRMGKLDVSLSRLLLHHLKWDMKELVKRLSADRRELLASARLNIKGAESSISLLGECPICLWPVDSSRTMQTLACGHTFCEQCWLDYILSRISEGVSTGLECLQCSSVVVMEEVVKQLSSQHSDALSRYLRYSLSDYVLTHSLLRWCPGPDCSIIFSVHSPQPKKVSCSKCSACCCFSCGEEYHCPTGCAHYKEWMKKCQDDTETANYIIANTKDCPNCHTSIEKDGGCNHMNCSQCRVDFCWMCMGPWKDHNGYYNCSKYKADPKEKVDQARKALEKYLFYYERWANHDSSLKLEENTRRKIVSRMEQKVSKGEGTWIDWQYLLDAVGLLRKCRYTLKYTYPYAYFLTGDKKPLFEYQQAQLEVEIENLSWKVERAETTHVAELRQQMNSAEVMRLTLLRDVLP